MNAQDKCSKKSLSERPLGYLLAALGGIPGGPFGLIVSPGVLFILSVVMKSKNGSKPNRFLVWALIGIIGVPLSCSPLLRNTDKKSGGTQIDLAKGSDLTSKQVVPLGVEAQVRDGRALKVSGSSALSSISVSNRFFDPVQPKGGRLVAVYMTIKNTGKESGNLFWSSLQLVDNQGRKYDKIQDFDEIITVNAWVKEQGMSDAGDQLFPGASAQVVSVFRVSPNAEGLKLFVNQSKYFSIN